MAKCSKAGCEVEIIFVTSPNGARLPVDSVPIPNAMVAERFAVLYSIDRDSLTDPPGAIAWRRKDGDYVRAYTDGVELRASHFATCVAPSMFSSKGRR